MNIQSSARLSELRKKLLNLYATSPDDLSPFLSSGPLMKGTVYPLRRKCSNPSCRCARGERHETIVLTANVGGKTRLWSLPEESREVFRQRTESYRRYRAARARWIEERHQRQKEILGVIDAIAKERTQSP